MLLPPVKTTVFKDVGTLPKILIKVWLTEGIVMLVKPVQPLNAESPIVVTLFGNEIFAKLVQLLNAELPIVVTLFGIVIFVKPVQPLNVKVLIVVTPAGSVILIKLVQP